MEKPRRESKSEFWARMKREGRCDEAKATEAELLAQGLDRRTVQARVVADIQPLDGSRTVAWLTPNSWANGRVDAKKPPLDPQEQSDLDCEWAHCNPDRELPEAPTHGARLWLQMRQERPLDFLKEHEKCAARLSKRRRSELKAQREKVREKRRVAYQRQLDQQNAVRREAAKQALEAKRKKWREDRAASRERARQAEEAMLERQRQREQELARQKAEQARLEERRRKEQEKAKRAEEQRSKAEAELRELAREAQTRRVEGDSEEI